MERGGRGGGVGTVAVGGGEEWKCLVRGLRVLSSGLTCSFGTWGREKNGE